MARIQTMEKSSTPALNAFAKQRALSAFACLHCYLASLGIYGVLSYAVTSARRRSACACTRRDSRGIMLSFGIRCLALTLTTRDWRCRAAMASRLLTTLLYGFRPDYIPTVAVWPASRASRHCGFLPARRASRIDPMWRCGRSRFIQWCVRAWTVEVRNNETCAPMISYALNSRYARGSAGQERALISRI